QTADDPSRDTFTPPRPPLPRPLLINHLPVIPRLRIHRSERSVEYRGAHKSHDADMPLARRKDETPLQTVCKEAFAYIYAQSTTHNASCCSHGSTSHSHSCCPCSCHINAETRVCELSVFQALFAQNPSLCVHPRSRPTMPPTSSHVSSYISPPFATLSARISPSADDANLLGMPSTLLTPSLPLCSSSFASSFLSSSLSLLFILTCLVSSPMSISPAVAARTPFCPTHSLAVSAGETLRWPPL
ncbi:hypothetical protein BD289DRAFT_501540, partial [Coniella lustricola]